MKKYTIPSEEIFIIEAEDIILNSADFEKEHYHSYDQETDGEALTRKKGDYPWNGGIWDAMNEE